MNILIKQEVKSNDREMGKVNSSTEKKVLQEDECPSPIGQGC